MDRKTEKLYKYIGDKLTDKSLKNKQCKAVLNSQGKCIVSKRATMLVDFDGIKHVVLRRRLRKINL